MKIHIGSVTVTTASGEDSFTLLSELIFVGLPHGGDSPFLVVLEPGKAGVHLQFDQTHR